MAATTPISERVHIAIFGRTNDGKSTLMNRLVGHDVAIVSDKPGTTTDPVQKALEVNGLGAAVLVDTPGLDDTTELGGERMARTAKVLDKTDIAIVLFSSAEGASQLRIIEECRIREIPTIVVLNKMDATTDLEATVNSLSALTKHRVIAISALTGEGIETLRQAIVDSYKQEERLITEGFCKAGDNVLLVMPQDKSAPKGRLIQPQVQTIRELLDRGCTPICCTPDRMAATLATLASPPELIQVLRSTPRKVQQCNSPECIHGIHR